MTVEDIENKLKELESSLENLDRKILKLDGVETRGKFNDIAQTAKIGFGTKLSGWTFIGHNVKIGKYCKIGNFVEINSDCIIGENTNIQPYVVLNSGTKIGKNSMLAGYVKTADEKYLSPDTENIKRTPCEIGDNVRVGINSSLISTKIGNNSVIGADSLVLRTVPPDQVWMGSPAKFLMSRKEYDQKLRLIQSLN